MSTRMGSTFPAVVARHAATSNTLNPFRAEAASPVSSGILVNTIPSFGSDASITLSPVGVGDGVGDPATALGGTVTFGGFCPPEEQPAIRPTSAAPTTTRATTRILRAPCLTRTRRHPLPRPLTRRASPYRNGMIRPGCPDTHHDHFPRDPH